MTAKEATFLLEFFARIFVEAPLLCFWCTGTDRLPIVTITTFAECLEGCFLLLVLVGGASADRLVGRAIIQRHREGQNMIDLNVAGQQASDADRVAGIRTFAVGAVSVS